MENTQLSGGTNVIIWALRVFCSVLKMNVGERNKGILSAFMPRVWECFTVQLLSTYNIYLCICQNYTITIQNSDLVWNCSGTLISNGTVDSWATSFSSSDSALCIFRNARRRFLEKKMKWGGMFAWFAVFCSPYLRLRCKKRIWDDSARKKEREKEKWKAWFLKNVDSVEELVVEKKEF